MHRDSADPNLGAEDRLAVGLLGVSQRWDDLILPPPNGHLQALGFINSHDASLVTMPNTGHCVLLESNAPIFRDQLHNWMAQPGL